MQDLNEQFRQECKERVASYAKSELKQAANEFMKLSTQPKYSYNFTWMGRPVIQYPQDMVAMQELIWHTRPDLIIETGIAHGGSLVLSASMLAMLDMCEAIEADSTIDPRESARKVLGIDIDIRKHNLDAILAHPMASRIDMIEGSSIASDTIRRVKKIAANYERVLVCLDSNHTHEHVLEELKAYAPLVSSGSYCVVFDTIVEDLPSGMYPERSWGPGDNPKTAVWEYLKTTDQFEIDHEIENKLLITVAPNGFLKRVR